MYQNPEIHVQTHFASAILRYCQRLKGPIQRVQLPLPQGALPLTRILGLVAFLQARLRPSFSAALSAGATGRPIAAASSCGGASRVPDCKYLPVRIGSTAFIVWVVL